MATRAWWVSSNLTGADHQVTILEKMSKAKIAAAQSYILTSPLTMAGSRALLM